MVLKYPISSQVENGIRMGGEVRISYAFSLFLVAAMPALVTPAAGSQ
jgi:hypothetical protein